jgi:hypothetical protein
LLSLCDVCPDFATFDRAYDVSLLDADPTG